MRLFTALWPPSEVAAHLRDVVRRVPRRQWDEITSGARGFRLLPAELWHLTLCFHGDSGDPDALGDRLATEVQQLSERDPGLGDLRLRLAGAGTFRGVLWVGAHTANPAAEEALHGLVSAAGGDPDSFAAHLTLARWNRGQPDRQRLTGVLADYAGPWWTVDAVTLVRSERTSEGPAYSSVRRVALTRPPSGHGGTPQ